MISCSHDDFISFVIVRILLFHLVV